MIQIEKSIPIPGHTKGPRGASKYPIRIMEIGDSFIVECPDDLDSKRRTISNICSSMGRLKPKKFTTRLVEGGVRCWRIE